MKQKSDRIKMYKTFYKVMVCSEKCIKDKGRIRNADFSQQKRSKQKSFKRFYIELLDNIFVILKMKTL